MAWDMACSSARLLIALMLVSTAVMVAPASPATACVSARAPFDSFTGAVPAAATIVVGTVEGLADRERNSRIRIRTDEVLRGRAPAAMRFSGLSGSESRSLCGDKSTVVARDGDRLALAISKAVPGEPLRVEAVAFVGRSRPNRPAMPQVQRLPLRTVRRLARQTGRIANSRPYDAGRAADNLITERIARGVARVSERGMKHDLKAIRQLDVSPDDRVWAATRTHAFQLGRRIEYRIGPGRPWAIGEITAQPTGWAVTTARGVRRFEEDRGWDRLSRRDELNTPWWPMMTTSGEVWAHTRAGPARLVDGDWTVFGSDLVDPPSVCVNRLDPLERSDCTTTRFAEAPDGSVWLGYTASNDRTAGGLRQFDGADWSATPNPLDVRSFGVSHLASDPGGPVWAVVRPRDGVPGTAGLEAKLARWDGDTWTDFDLPTPFDRGRRTQPRELVAGPDGSVWLSRPLARFDGEAWQVFDVPSRRATKKPRIADLSIASDGSAWMVVRDQVKFKTTRPDGIYILDPDRAEAVHVIPADPA